mgnify:CR=1 FL=1
MEEGEGEAVAEAAGEHRVALAAEDSTTGMEVAAGAVEGRDAET